MKYTFLVTVGATPIPSHLTDRSADELFQAGFDTFDIAAHFKIHESEALQLVGSERSARLGRTDHSISIRSLAACLPTDRVDALGLV